MDNILSFSEYIELCNLIESIDIVNNRLDFKSEDNKDRGISTSFGKGKKLKPYTKTIEGVDGLVSYSLYQAKTTNATEIMKALKSSDFSDPEVQQFLNRSAVYAARILRGLNVDVIVTPQSSSPLTKEFVAQISRRTNYDVVIDAFRKRPDLTKVEIDRDHPKITPDIIASMERILSRAIKNGFLSVKQFAVQHRKFIKNLFEVTDDRLYKKIENKNVVIIDDIMTSGTTTKNIYDILKTNQAENISALTIFKSTK